MNNNQAKPLYQKDYFTQQDDREYAGKHILIDLWGAKDLDDKELLTSTLIKAVEAANATLLHIHVHQFTPTGGLSGAAILAESHINVHTWPERGFAAFDVFMCGNAQPEKVEAVIKQAFRPERSTIELRYRGETHKNVMALG